MNVLNTKTSKEPSDNPVVTYCVTQAIEFYLVTSVTKTVFVVGDLV